MICKACNNEIPEGGYFCPKCGTRCQEGVHPLLRNKAENEAQILKEEKAVIAEAMAKEEKETVADYYNTAAKVGFIGGTRRFFKNRHKSKMRASRSEFWWGLLGALLHWAIVGMIKAVLGPDNFFVGILGFLLMIPIYIGFITLNIRRLHDSGSNGNWFWFAFLPVVGWIILVVKCCKKSDGENKWGTEPVKMTRKQRKEAKQALKEAKKASKKAPESKETTAETKEVVPAV